MMTDEKFFAWLDGELEAAEAADIAAMVAASPEWSRRADEHRAMQAELRGAFAPLVEAPVPDRIGAAPVDFATARAERSERRRMTGPIPQWAAMAATLVLGLGVGTMVGTGRGGDSPVAVEQGRLVATAGLETALSTRLASAPADSGPRIGLTFRDQSGTLCRSFSDSAASGLACHEGGEWRLRGLFQGGGGQGDYRMAAGEDPRLAALIDGSIAGEPLDAAGERAALDTLPR